VWSLGISLIELALGRFPFSESASDDDSDLSDFEGTLSPARPVPLEKKKKDKSKESKRNRRKSKGVSLQGGGMTMSILELLQHIVNEPAPKLTSDGRFPKIAEDFVNSCLLKDPDQRMTPKDLLVRLPVTNSFFLIFLNFNFACFSESRMDRSLEKDDIRSRGVGKHILIDGTDGRTLEKIPGPFEGLYERTCAVVAFVMSGLSRCDAVRRDAACLVRVREKQNPHQLLV
jgi:serine/threonine protein kinase